MSLAFCSFSSGSSGNCYLVKTENSVILIDAGISAKRILGELKRADTSPEEVQALFLTHEHHDHISGARVLMNKIKNSVCFASKGTFSSMDSRDRFKQYSFERDVSEDRRIAMAPNEAVEVGDLTVRAFRTQHDAAEPYGYHISSGDKRIALMTDTGIVTDEMLDFAADADILVLESNHDTDLLRMGSYPPYLKQRILSSNGHLSNIQAAEALLRLFELNDKGRVVLLAHLSEENNRPVEAERTVLTALARRNYYTGNRLYIGVLLRNEASLVYRI
jgi:phosphoribosyl 1,2-cyclic phosphodiesterase